MNDDLCWYVGYGSNLLEARFGCYLAGGRPPGAARANRGARDPRPPRDRRPLWLDGDVFFAGRATTWGGGVAFHDPAGAGSTAARAYLVTVEQFVDVAAQEMGRPDGVGIDVGAAVAAGSAVLGDGWYETLLCCGELDGLPLLTFTGPLPRGSLTPAPPSAAYLQVVGAGLIESHGWDPATAAGHLCGLEGCAGAWDVASVAALLGSDED